MHNWQEGQYNSDYILHHKCIIGQLKYESKNDPARLDEISIERHNNGDICVVFTTHPDATNDARQHGIHARLAYNTLFQEMQRLVAIYGLEYTTSSLEEVHRLRGRKGQERALIQALILLEEYDNTLAQISKVLHHYIAPAEASAEDITEEIQLQKARLHLLEQVLAKSTTRRSSSFKQKAMTRKRRSRVTSSSGSRKQA